MRLFAAVDPDPAVRAAAERAARAVARRLGSAPESAENEGSRSVSRAVARRLGGSAREQIRWVAPEQLHATLRFLGEVTDADADAVRAVLRAPFETGAFLARVSRLGCFPPSGSPRVVWLGIGEGGDGIAAVRAELDRRLASVGFPSEDRPFRAHLTLGRMKRWPARSRRDVDRVLSEVRPETPAWTVDCLTLYESRRMPHGARYHVLQSTPLAAPGGPPRTEVGGVSDRGA